MMRPNCDHRFARMQEFPYTVTLSFEEDDGSATTMKEVTAMTTQYICPLCGPISTRNWPMPTTPEFAALQAKIADSVARKTECTCEVGKLLGKMFDVSPAGHYSSCAKSQKEPK